MKVLPYACPPSPPKYLKEEKEDSVPQDSVPPYPESFVNPKKHTLIDIENLG